jgi:hypothetical protein
MKSVARWRETALSLGTLVLSTGTLLCCALPILLVSLGLGAAVAGIIGAAPWLVTLSWYKAWLFTGTAALLIAGGFFMRRPSRVCPTDPDLARACAAADRWNRRIWWLAVGIWTTGVFMAYLWLPLRQLANG